MEKEKLKILFMGTPEFAVESLKALYDNKFNICGVVTVADKPAGRGQKIQISPVKEYAISKNLKILQPEKLKSDLFLKQLHELNPDLIVVVAFRMLPKEVWAFPRFGTINVHGSLLPQYRGAAPINWAIINGEKETGVTTFFIEEQIDTGKIIDKSVIPILDSDNAGSLHDKLMVAGAGLLVKTVKGIINQNIQPVNQAGIQTVQLKPAPKIFKENCRIDWGKKTKEIWNFIRGLSPYPAAWTEFKDKNGQPVSVKIFHAQPFEIRHAQKPGDFISDNKTFIHAYCPDGYISIQELQLAGKKRMNTDEFLRGNTQIVFWKYRT